jgi:hypothetical protein
VKKYFMALVVRTSKAGVAQHARVVFLARPAIPRDVARREHMSAGSLIRFC